MVAKRRPLAERLLERVVKTPSGCWEYTGTLNHKGYGEICEGGAHGRTKRAHRVSYELFVGPIPTGKLIRHSCHNPPCVNPDHLKPGTHLENMKDRRERKLVL